MAYNVTNIEIISGSGVSTEDITSNFDTGYTSSPEPYGTITITPLNGFTVENDLPVKLKVTYTSDGTNCDHDPFDYIIPGSGGGSITVEPKSMSWNYNEYGSGKASGFTITKNGNVTVGDIYIEGEDRNNFTSITVTEGSSYKVYPIGVNDDTEDFTAEVKIPYSIGSTPQDPKTISLTQYKNSVVPTDYVEIGGIKWAIKNVGANSVTDTGLYFQWADTQGYTAAQVGSGSGKKYFYWSDYKYGTGINVTKYNSTDGKTTIESSDDAAYNTLGDNWRIPTNEEYATLISETTTAWTTDYQGSGVSGVTFTDNNDSSKVLFFPSAGRASLGEVSSKTGGFYWTSSLFTNTVSQAYNIYTREMGVRSEGSVRCYGFLIRPIKADSPTPPTPTDCSNASAYLEPNSITWEIDESGEKTLSLISDTTDCTPEIITAECDTSKFQITPASGTNIKVRPTNDSPSSEVTDTLTVTYKFTNGNNKETTASLLQHAESPTPTEFTLTPLLMSTRMGQNIVSEFSNEYIGATGNALFLCKVKGANVDDITITVSPQGSNFIINKISDWGFLMIKNGTWGYWPGGIGGSTWQEDITFSYDEKSYTAKFRGELDEDNTELLMGACTNKVFRIPGNGTSSFTTYCLYPYNFNSNYFGMTGFDLTYYDIENNVQGKPISSDNLSDTIFTSLSQQTDGLNVKLNYSVGPNTTNKYRFGAICAGKTLVHFIQDPQSTTMIYFGRAPYDRYIKDDRIIPDENDEYLFHQLGSYNLGDTYNLSSTVGYTLLYPINLSDTYDITYKGGTPTELAGTYTWGEVTYKRFSCGSNITFKFIKK